MKKILITSLLCNIILTQAMTGLELAEKINNKPEPKDSKSLILMDLINLKRNKTRTSEMVSISTDNGDKMLLFFKSPKSENQINVSFRNGIQRQMTLMRLGAIH